MAEDTILDQGYYIYPSEELVDKVFDILRNYNYSYAVRDLMLDENTHVIAIHVENRVDSERNYPWFDNHLFGFLTEADLSKEIYQIFTEYTRRVLLQEVKSIISENTGEMPWSAMF